MSEEVPRVTMRRARLEDLPAVVALLADDMLGREREDPALPLDEGYGLAFAAIERDANQMLMVAEADGRVVGTLQLTFVPGLSSRGAWRGLVEGVRVARAERGRRIGEQMLRWAIEACRARGCAKVQLATNLARVDAQRFYERLGFTATHAGYVFAL